MTHNGNLWFYRSLTFCKKYSQEMVLQEIRGKLFVPPEEPIEKGRGFCPFVPDILWFCIKKIFNRSEFLRDSPCVRGKARCVCVQLYFEVIKKQTIFCVATLAL